MHNICHICSLNTCNTHMSNMKMCTHSICEHIHVQVYTMFAEHTHGRHICMPTQYTQHDMYIWTYIFPTFFNHLAALCSSTREAQHLTGSPQHQKAAGTSRSHRKACDHRPGHRTDPPKAKQPVVCHMGPCGHSVGDTVISFREVYNNILSYWNCEPPEEQT